MNAALRAAELFNINIHPSFEAFVPERSGTCFGFKDYALGACLEIAKRTSTSEPHFVWEDMGSVTISPSEFQFCSLAWNNDELVSIEEEDLPWRSYCVDAVAALERYAHLEHGWDGDEALPPSESSLADAHVFLRLVSSEIESCPNVTPGLDDEGIPTFIFDNRDTYISVSLYGEQSVTVYQMHRPTRKSSVATFYLSETEKLREHAKFNQRPLRR
ncbi:hypothetical protein QIY50_07035 [Pseudomonas putida]|nr:hypothetical protein QIY50_07035 [Pseudomonas putida]